jgi:hypothetical protein
MLRARRCTRGRLTGNIRSRGTGRRRLLGRLSLSAFPWNRLVRSSGASLTGNARFRCCVGLRHLRRPLRLRAALCRSRGLRARQVRAGLCFGPVRFWCRLRFRHALASRFRRFWFRLLSLFSPLFLPWPWCRLFLWLLRKSNSSQGQRRPY